jgi:uncharacterized circularly permuted ATP-grasp superfamily protein/uncharacterized alpha-E superfamily protein
VHPALAVAPTEPYDEFLLPGGGVRPHQERLAKFLESLAPPELERLRSSVLHRINEQEVTFNILGVPEGTNRPWRLDPIPLLLDAIEWTELSRGLAQRARVLSAALEDLFGPQRLLHERIIPPQLVLGHPGFARACHGWTPVGGHHLHLYAADVGRDQDGRFVTFSDRTAAPTGAGYTLENRLVLGRALAGLFQEYGVERLRHFFDTTRELLWGLAPKKGREPRVVVLSAGAQDESSFEHAYLARYLGFELVEGRDLTVRDRVLYLKTLAGLRRVDVVLRRVLDQLCDPVELRADSFRGVPGLVGAARAGNVALANFLGAGLVEAPAFKAYLPRMARALLGEPLQLPSVPTHWCGDAESLELVVNQLDEFVIKPAFFDRQGEPLLPRTMSAEERTKLVERLRSSPAQFVAERWPSLSVAPRLDAVGLGSGDISIRAFLCRREDDYLVMPGGLARVNAPPDGLFLSARGDSKDIWIPSHRDDEEGALLAMPDQRLELRRGGLDLPSRLLDDIFWLGRHIERCDMMARLVRAGLERLDTEVGDDAPLVLDAILATLTAMEAIPGSPDHSRVAAEALLLGAVLDDERQSSLKSLFRTVHELTVRVRSRLSRDAWNVLRRVTSPFEQVDNLGRAATIELLDDVLVALAAFVGTTLDNMVRGHVWMFLDMGRRVERGSQTLSLVQNMLPPGAVRMHMEALLEVADSLLTYRARYLSSLQVAPVVDLLVTDETNPKSLAFQVQALHEHVLNLPRLDDVVRSRAERRIIALGSTLMTVDVPHVCAGDGSGLRQLLEDAADLLWQFSDDVTQTWFSHAPASHALFPPSWVDEQLEAK